MKKIEVLTVGICAAVLAACVPFKGSESANASAESPQLGSDAWYEWVDEKAGVSDGHGHGPDYGSGEWCQAANWRVFGQRNNDETVCSQEWMQAVDQTLKSKGH